MNEMQIINIIIADAHPLYRLGLRTFLENLAQINYHVIAEATTGIELVEKAEKYLPHIIITSIDMPEMNGIKACKIIKEKHPKIAVIALTLHEQEYVIMQMISAGASGYLLKNSYNNEILLALKAVVEGFVFYSSCIKNKITNITNENNCKVVFSDCEIKIINLVGKQFTNNEIALSLGLHVRSIEDSRGRIKEKMKVKNSIGIVLYALEYGIIHLNELE